MIENLILFLGSVMILVASTFVLFMPVLAGIFYVLITFWPLFLVLTVLLILEWCRR